MLKRSIALLFTLCLLTLCACGTKPTVPPDPADTKPDLSATTVRMGGLTGPTSLGLLQLMDEAQKKTSEIPYEFTLAASADALVPKLAKGELDMAAIPANLAAVLYQSTEGAIRVLAVNTLGVLSLVERGGETVQSIADLRGKTIYATGKGSTPEYTLRYLLQENGLDPDKDVTIEFRSEPTEVVSLLASKPEGIAMLPQPFVTVAQDKLEGLRIALDLTAAWDALETDSTLITGVMVARREFVEANPAVVAAFMDQYKRSIEFTVSQPAEAAVLSEEFGIVKANIAERAIPHCNLRFLAGTEMKTALSAYLEVLYAQNPAAVGKTLPDDAFYFGA